MTELCYAEREGAVIVQLPAETAQHDYLDMRRKFQQRFLDHGRTRIVIDCEDAQDLPSIAFGAFCGLSRDARKRGGFVRLIHVAAPLRAIMARTHLDRQVPVFNTLAEALHADDR